MVRRRSRKPKIAGSNPVRAYRLRLGFGCGALVSSRMLSRSPSVFSFLLFRFCSGVLQFLPFPGSTVTSTVGASVLGLARPPADFLDPGHTPLCSLLLYPSHLQIALLLWPNHEGWVNLSRIPVLLVGTPRPRGESPTVGNGVASDGSGSVRSCWFSGSRGRENVPSQKER